MFWVIVLVVLVGILCVERGFYYYKLSKLTKTNLPDFQGQIQEGFQTFLDQVRASIQAEISNFQLPVIDFKAVFEDGEVRQSLANIVMDSIVTLIGDERNQEQFKGYITGLLPGLTSPVSGSTPPNEPVGSEEGQVDTNRLIATLIAQKGQVWLTDQLEKLGSGLGFGIGDTRSRPSTGSKGAGQVR